MAAEKQVLLVGVDDSEHSFYALEWTLTHFFTAGSKSPFKLIVVHAKLSPTSVLGLAGPGATDVIPIVEADVKKTGEKVKQKVEELCHSRSVDVQVELVGGDPRNVICEAVEKHNATILVLGSHGYGVFKRALLGSVSDYCSHHAYCSVMIVKKPKAKPTHAAAPNAAAAH